MNLETGSHQYWPEALSMFILDQLEINRIKPLPLLVHLGVQPLNVPALWVVYTLYIRLHVL